MISVNCPAKINIGLRVLGLRADGYHDLSGLMVAIPWFDRVDIDTGDFPDDDIPECLPGIRLKVVRDPECRADAIPRDSSNIVVRAAARCIERPGVAALAGFGGVSIRLSKSIPAGTGLGGASSDAAGTIMAMDLLARSRGLAGLSFQEMKEIAAAVGSDSVFFLNPVPSTIVGRGEDFAPVAFPTDFTVVVIVPLQRLSTGAVFASWDERRKCSNPAEDRLTGKAHGDISPCLLVHPVPGKTDGPAPELFENDLSEAVFDVCPRSAELLGILRDSGAFAASVTGSGSAVFGLFGDTGSAFGFGRTMSANSVPGEIVRVFQMGQDF